MVATDGQRLTLGDTTLTMYVTPGHTPGTISTLIPVRDQGRPHLAAEWGGTGFNFTITPDKPRRFWFETYAASAEHFRNAVGHTVTLRTPERKRLKGEVVSAGESSVVVQSGNNNVEIPYDAIVRGNLVYTDSDKGA